jgi:hypothetical protein
VRKYQGSQSWRGERGRGHLLQEGKRASEVTSEMPDILGRSPSSVRGLLESRAAGLET